MKGALVLCLLFALCMTSEAKGGFGSMFTGLAQKAKKMATKAVKGAIKSVLSHISGGETGETGETGEAGESSDEMPLIQDMNDEEYDRFIEATSDELSKTFMPDTVDRILDALDGHRDSFN